MDANDSIIIRLLDQIAVLVANKTTQHHKNIASNLRDIARHLELGEAYVFEPEEEEDDLEWFEDEDGVGLRPT